jgi:nicotinamidase-related amidase
MAGWNALPHIQALLGVAREAGIVIVHVTSRSDLGHWRRPGGARSAGRADGPDPFEIVPEVAPIGDEPVIRKAAPSAFWGTPLVAYLNQMRVDTTIVVGESTSGCVRATVVDAASHRFRVAVVEECVFDRHEAAHAINLFDIEQKYGDVIGLEDTIGYIRSLPASTAAMEQPEVSKPGTGRPT